jgi:acyl-CoA thioesterase FadM
MPRIKIEMPEHFTYTTEMPVRISDINYGGHLSNDSIVSLIHEARVRFLAQYNYGTSASGSGSARSAWSARRPTSSWRMSCGSSPP